MTELLDVLRMKCDYILRAAAIIAALIIVLICALTGANGLLHFLAGALVAYGIGLGAKILKKLFT